MFDELKPEDRAAAADLVRDSGIDLAIHAPFTSLNIAALNPGARAEAIRQTLQAIDLCAELGGSAVVVHTGEHVLSPNFRAKAPYAHKVGWDNNVRSLQIAANFAREQQVTLCLENIGFEPDHMDRNVDDLLRIRDEVGADGGPEIFFTLDIGHARLNNELPAAIEKLGPLIRHIHFTDNFGKIDDHLTIGEGNFDYTPHLDFFRGFQGIITLEVVKIGTDPAAALKSLKFVRELLG